MATISISAQYYENYSDTENPYWKPKGEQVFLIEANFSADILIYTDTDELKKQLEILVAEKSCEHFKYKYLSHHLTFVDYDKSISSDDLLKKLTN